ncbi:hypothetical protein [Tardiphaga sp. 709]|jgi:hypothetical protein|uniref:hypothetical protein n=1 Tax=unclassified Tardiphaga TaxID=2631404 RepID=UPI0028EA9196|nr:hypothetical protein [Tardiphaga sp. 709]WNV11922.1 hypothetical protein RSO67_12545 [Tardiphaga sp. 709]
MKELQTYRAMESLCRQRAAHFPEESWKHLADAEMWRHKAMDLIAEHHVECNQPEAA